MPHGIGDRLPKKLLKFELKPYRDGRIVIARIDVAVHRPLLGEPSCKCLELFDGLRQLELAVATERGDEGANLALLLDEQPLQFG